jgi:two-component system OmpR family sensor kinase
MRTLSFSLILVVIISTLGLGWVFDNIYQQFSSPELNPNTANVAKQLVSDLARAANESSDEMLFCHIGRIQSNTQWYCKI